MGTMSFINEIIKKKNELKTVQTLTTSPMGYKYIERKNDAGEIKIDVIEKSCVGFVIDDQPDLQVAEILDYLYLGSQDPVHDKDLLKKLSITHVLSIGIRISESERIPEITFKLIELDDEPTALLKNVLADCFDFIERAKKEKEKNKIFVHCNAGYSRAPSIVIAYLMKTYKYTFEQALNKVRNKRFVKPNEGFIKQLKDLENNFLKNFFI